VRKAANARDLESYSSPGRTRRCVETALLKRVDGVGDGCEGGDTGTMLVKREKVFGNHGERIFVAFHRTLRKNKEHSRNSGASRGDEGGGNVKQTRR